jgi:hypothetical protein
MAMRGRSIHVPMLTVRRRFEPRRGGKAAMASGYEVVVPLMRRRVAREVSSAETLGADVSTGTQAPARAEARGGV